MHAAVKIRGGGELRLPPPPPPPPPPSGSFPVYKIEWIRSIECHCAIYFCLVWRRLLRTRTHTHLGQIQTQTQVRIRRG